MKRRIPDIPEADAATKAFAWAERLAKLIGSTTTTNGTLTDSGPSTGTVSHDQTS